VGTLTSKIKILGFYLQNYRKIAAAENLFRLCTAPMVLVKTKFAFVLGRTPKTFRFLPQIIDIDIDIFVNWSWVGTRWQYTFTRNT
jgi:hypothetical protein